MKESEQNALKDIRGYARAGRITISPHARKRMAQRGVWPDDLSQALRMARRCKAQESGRWKVFGADKAGDDLTVIVEIEDDLIVVTLF